MRLNKGKEGDRGKTSDQFDGLRRFHECARLYLAFSRLLVDHMLSIAVLDLRD